MSEEDKKKDVEYTKKFLKQLEEEYPIQFEKDGKFKKGSKPWIVRDSYKIYKLKNLVEGKTLDEITWEDVGKLAKAAVIVALTRGGVNLSSRVAIDLMKIMIPQRVINVNADVKKDDKDKVEVIRIEFIDSIDNNNNNNENQ
jgi:hypothetical protein